MIRVGIGFDSHPLVEGRPLVLGGVAVPYERGLDGHSDADVVAHAIVDALLGAAALGDIGTHFPASDSRFKGVSSITFLESVAGLLTQNRWRIANIDATIIAQRPRLSPHLSDMRATVSRALRLDQAQISIKATSTNGLGFLGRGEGIAAQAVALIESMP